MAHFIDRRLNAKGKSTVNRQRFIRRYKEQIKKAVSEAIGKRSVTDIESGEKIGIPKRDMSEPSFHTTKGGVRERVHPGNDQFITGDKIKRPPEGNGKGGGDASPDGEGQDDFVFELSRDEYLDLLFEDLALPNLNKLEVDKVVDTETYRAGYTTEGTPGNLDVVRSLEGSMARRIALTGKKRRRLGELESQLADVRAQQPVNPHLEAMLLDEIQALKSAIAAVPFIDTFDLRFRHYGTRQQPSTRAVMFCLMDVSGSMDRETKDKAKRFYILLYLFLSRCYDNVEVIYIRHHTQAKEVDEQEFFYSQETGGTIVSSALKLMDEIITERYPPSSWNIYAAQASDGDNWADDSPTCVEVLESRLLPKVRYFAYVEVTERDHQSLWHRYEVLTQRFDNFAIKHIKVVEDIYPVFRELFSRQVS